MAAATSGVPDVSFLYKVGGALVTADGPRGGGCARWTERGRGPRGVRDGRKVAGRVWRVGCGVGRAVVISGQGGRAVVSEQGVTAWSFCSGACSGVWGVWGVTAWSFGTGWFGAGGGVAAWSFCSGLENCLAHKKNQSETRGAGNFFS